MILFLVICAISVMGLYFIFRKPAVIKKQLSPNQVIITCEKIYIEFINMIQKRNFQQLANFCSMDLLTQIQQIQFFAKPLGVFYRDIKQNNNYIQIEFWSSSIKGNIKDICTFLFNPNNTRLTLIGFNNIGYKII